MRWGRDNLGWSRDAWDYLNLRSGIWRLRAKEEATVLVFVCAVVIGY